MKLRGFAIFLVAIFLTVVSGVAIAGGWNGYPTVNLLVNGITYTGDVPPIMVENRVFLPVRGVTEAIGGKVSWDDTTQTVSLTTVNTTGLVARAETAETQVSSLQGELQGTKQDLQKAKNDLSKNQAELKQAQERIRQLESAVASTPATAKPKDRQELISQLKGRVYRLDVYDLTGQIVSTGSAVAIGTTELMTNYHVIKDAARVVAHGENDVTFDVVGMLIGREDYDLAILRVNKTLTPVTTRTDEPKVGEDVIAIGSPQGLTNTVSTGIVSATRNLNGITILQLTAPISHGSSGGGLFDQNGALIGITFASLVDGQNLNFAIPMKIALPLIQEAKTANLQQFPGANRPTLANLVQVISAKYPTFTVGGKTIRPTYTLIKSMYPSPGQASHFLSVDLGMREYGDFLGGLLTGDFAANQRTVDNYLSEVGKIVQQVFPGKAVTVDIFHVASYSNYPLAFDANEVSYRNGLWSVVRLVVQADNPSGEWRFYWR